MQLGFFEKLGMYSFFMANKDNPDKLAEEYQRNPEKWAALKEEYPDWEKYVNMFPDLRDSLRSRGIPL